MLKIPDIPRDECCLAVNPELFRYFQLKLLRLTGQISTPNWTEAEVIQWLDTETNDKYNDEQLDPISF